MSSADLPMSRAFDLAFDERWIGDHGIGRFAREIAARWPRLKPAGMGGKPSGPLDCLRTSFWLLRHPRRMLFTPGYNAPLLFQARCVLAVHDLNHIDSPERQSLLKRLYYRWVLRRACRTAPCVLTVSEYSRRRIIEWSGASENRIVNVGNGVSSVFRPASISRNNSETPYFLSVSNRKPHKNEKRLLTAFQAADLPSNVKLRISGEATPAQLAWIRRHGLAERIEFLGVVSDDELAEYYRGAHALLFVSLYEGFGLPAVEAMACGTPVVAANATSLPEVVGDAALLVDPFSADRIRGAIERIWADAPLRQDLQKNGLARRGRFDWDGVAERVHRALTACCRDVRLS